MKTIKSRRLSQSLAFIGALLQTPTVFAEETPASSSSSSDAAKTGNKIQLSLSLGIPTREFAELDLTGQDELLPPATLALGFHSENSTRQNFFELFYSQPLEAYLPILGFQFQTSWKRPGIEFGFDFSGDLRLPSDTQPSGAVSESGVTLPIEAHSMLLGLRAGHLTKAGQKHWLFWEYWSFFDSLVAKIDGVEYKRGQNATYSIGYEGILPLLPSLSLKARYALIYFGKASIFSSDYLEPIASETIQNFKLGMETSLGSLILGVHYSYIPKVSDSLAMFSRGPFTRGPFLLAQSSVYGEIKWEF